MCTLDNTAPPSTINPAWHHGDVQLLATNASANKTLASSSHSHGSSLDSRCRRSNDVVVASSSDPSSRYGSQRSNDNMPMARPWCGSRNDDKASLNAGIMTSATGNKVQCKLQPKAKNVPAALRKLKMRLGFVAVARKSGTRSGLLVLICYNVT